MIATISFDRSDITPDWDQTDIYGLQEIIMIALDQHFSSYGAAAEAQRQFLQVQADVAADTTLTLFGAGEAMQASLMAHPAAFEWSAFEREAVASIAPFDFSMRFTE